MFSHFLFPSTCFHCEEPLFKNSGICSTCFQALSLQERREEVVFDNHTGWQGSLFPPINPLIDLLEKSLQKQHERMIQLFCALLVIQADLLGFPWCDALLLVPAPTLSTSLRRVWQHHLTRFFQVPLIPPRVDVFSERQTLYLIDWFLEPKEVYDPLISDLQMIYPHEIVILTIFDQ
jgi:hypothetical protein